MAPPANIADPIIEKAICKALNINRQALSPRRIWRNSPTQVTWTACLFLTFYSPLHLNLESVKDFLAAGIGQREDDTFGAGLVGGGDYPR